MSSTPNPTPEQAFLENSLADLVSACTQGLVENAERLVQLRDWICSAFEHGGKVLLFGNGGSAADAQHVAAEFVNRFRINRRPLPAIALTTDSSILTSVANDFSYDDIFSKQVEALAREQDIVIGISTSGNSPNVVKALEAARTLGARTVAFAGAQGGRVLACADLVLAPPSSDTPRIQETHIFFAHLLCDLVERKLFAS